MNRSLELAQEKDASFTDFLRYFLRLRRSWCVHTSTQQNRLIPLDPI